MKNLKHWFLQEKRDLPWRNHPSPYSVWVSEVMLQQTQVSVVIPYFERWMELFPTIKDLASSPLEAVIKAWEGLGYYSRARNLHAGAIFLMEKYDGVFPDDRKEWQKIKGLGPYTINAIRAFAFHEKAAPVDGNVIRVLTRLFNRADDISKSQTVNKLRIIAEELLPEDEPWIHSEALIELGAKICTKKPKCIRCPIRESCKAYSLGEAHLLPINLKKTVYEKLERTVFVYLYRDKVLLRRGEKNAIMSDLYEFPYTEGKSAAVCGAQELPLVSHSFTKFRVQLFPYLVRLQEELTMEGFSWHAISKLIELPFSSGHRRVLHHFLEEINE